MTFKNTFVSIYAVSKDFQFESPVEEFIKSVFTVAQIKRSRYRAFLNKLVKFATNNTYILDDVCRELTYGDCWRHKDTGKVALSIEDFEQDDPPPYDFIGPYLEGLANMRNKYPLLYNVWALVQHDSSSGVMECEQIQLALPTMKKFLDFYLTYERKFRNEDAEMRDFIFALITVMNKAIEQQGEMLFWEGDADDE